ncbi:MAG: hypothetical protein IJ446_08880 [Oscillospiraceae bacterium]|nr:hypothetical protein [Oscillospiraceae bacterium]
MGAWSTSITGNDTAQDLISEYRAAFFYNDTETAVSKIDAYVRREISDETDEELWCNYIYSLADFMWKKGILTPSVKEQALQLINSEAGLELWALSGEKTLSARKKAVEKLKQQLLSPQPPKKKITVNLYTKEIFNYGDIIAFQLNTVGKKYNHSFVKELSDEEFLAADGKYIAVQKIRTHVSYTSKIEPEVKDKWAVFRLFDGIFDHIPTMEEVLSCDDAVIQNGRINFSLFSCESSMYYFRKRKYELIGNCTDGLEQYTEQRCTSIFLGVNNDCYNPDSYFLSSFGKKEELCEFTGTIEEFAEIYYMACSECFHYAIQKSKEELQILRDNIIEKVRNDINSGKKPYCLKYGTTVGIFTIDDDTIENLAVLNRFQDKKISYKLLDHAIALIKAQGKTPCINIPSDHERMKNICRKTGFTGVISNSEATAHLLLRQ